MLSEAKHPSIFAEINAEILRGVYPERTAVILRGVYPEPFSRFAGSGPLASGVANGLRTTGERRQGEKPPNSNAPYYTPTGHYFL
jgi:hypothetical protein